MDETFDLIDVLGDSAKDISIFVNTNLSTLNYKDRFVLDYFKNFKQVVFHISCDGFGEIGEYIRFGFKTEKFKSNVNKVLDFIKTNSTNTKIDFDITYAISVINVYNIFEFLDTLKNDLGIDDAKVNFQTVGSPYNLSVSSLSLDEKVRITEYIKYKMLNYSDQTVIRLNKFLETINSTSSVDLFDSSLDTGLIKKIDVLRGNDIGKFVSEGVTGFEILVQDDGSLVLSPTVEIPARDAWIFQNKKAFASVKRGLEQASKGRTSADAVDFEKYLDLNPVNLFYYLKIIKIYITVSTYFSQFFMNTFFTILLY
jgi:hypothetical protein